MSINKSAIYKAVEKLENKLQPSSLFAAMRGGKTIAEVKNEVQREFNIALSEVPRFKELRIVHLDSEESQINHIRNIASNIFSLKGESPPLDDILRELFIPGTLYEEDIWVSQHSYVSDNAILLPYALIGKGCHVAVDTVIGPYSCIENHIIGTKAYVIKSIIGRFR